MTRELLVEIDVGRDIQPDEIFELKGELLMVLGIEGANFKAKIYSDEVYTFFGQVVIPSADLSGTDGKCAYISENVEFPAGEVERLSFRNGLMRLVGSLVVNNEDLSVTYRPGLVQTLDGYDTRNEIYRLLGYDDKLVEEVIKRQRLKIVDIKDLRVLAKSECSELTDVVARGLMQGILCWRELLDIEKNIGAGTKRLLDILSRETLH